MTRKSIFPLIYTVPVQTVKHFSHWSDQLLALNNWNKRKHDNLVMQHIEYSTYLWERRLSPLGVYP